MKIEEQIQKGINNLQKLRPTTAGLGGTIGLLKDTKLQVIALQNKNEAMKKALELIVEWAGPSADSGIWANAKEALKFNENKDY